MESIRGKWQPRAEQILKKIVRDHGVSPTQPNITQLTKQPIKAVWREYFKLSNVIDEQAMASDVAIALGESPLEIAEAVANNLASLIGHYKVALYLKARQSSSNDESREQDTIEF